MALDHTVRVVRRAALPVAAHAVGAVLVGVLTGAIGTSGPLLVTACLGGALGLMTASPVRRWTEVRAVGADGWWILSGACLVLGGLLAVLGLSFLAPAAATSAATHSVMLQPSRARLRQGQAVAVGTTAAALGAQALGWVGGVATVATAALAAGALLLLVLPSIAVAAGVARRAARATRALEEAARLDALTGLLGRRGLEEPLRRAAAAASPEAPTAVLFVDLDGFKAVNDSRGHAAGDQLLRVVAERLQRCVRTGDAVARTGGDEFVLVLPGLRDGGEAEEIAWRVRAEVADPVALDDGSWVAVGASTGVVVVSAPEDADLLLSAADSAMYAAKRASRLARNATPLCVEPGQRS